MNTLEEIRAYVNSTLQEEDVEDDLIDSLINEGLIFCSNHVRLSALEAVGTFIASPGSNSLIIPSTWNYQRGLYAAEVPEAPAIEIATSLDLTRDKYGAIEASTILGNIRVITVRSNSILYFPRPEVDVLVSCKFYKNPEGLVQESDTPDELPGALASALLRTYALWKIYPIIEDGVEEYKINTAHYKKAFYESLELLDHFIEEGQSSPDPIRNFSSWI